MTTKPPKHFTSDEFREMGHSTIDWIADYLEHLEERPVTPDVKPGDVRAVSYTPLTLPTICSV